MKILFLSSYIPRSFGGGERYLFMLATLLAKNGHEVFVSVNSSNFEVEEIKKQYESFLGFSLEKVFFIKTPIFIGDILSKLIFTKKFDAIFYFTDGSLFFSLSKRNILHFQIPFNKHESGLLNNLKLKNWPIYVANSYFTKSVIDSVWNINIQFVQYPVIISTNNFFKKKENIILHVGRFFRHLHNKKQEVLIRAFIKFKEKQKQMGKDNDWKLVLVGMNEDPRYVKYLKSIAKSYPIEFHLNISAKKLKSLFEKSKFYWHATGYGIDEKMFPQKMEHFGITTVEAMSYGLIPLVINKGGQKEIIKPIDSFLLWEDIDELVDKTIYLIDKKNLEFKKQLLTRIYNSLPRFDTFSFSKKVEQIFNVSLDTYENKVSWVIPSYNGLKLLKKNLDSVFKYMHDNDELVLIDDFSTDNTVNYFVNSYNMVLIDTKKDKYGKYNVYHANLFKKDKHIDFYLIENLTNLRFAKSVNRAVSNVRGKFFVLLNNDIVVESDLINATKKYMKQKNTFAVSFLEHDKKGQLHGRNFLWFEKGIFRHKKSKMERGKTSWACGGSSIFNTKKFIQLGGFDEIYYPAYWEDIDLSFRAYKKGYDVYFEPDAKVFHNHETTNAKIFNLKLLSYINSIKFTLKNSSIIQFFIFIFYLPYWIYQFYKLKKNETT